MKKQTLEMIKRQLGEIHGSSNLGYSAGLAKSILILLDSEFPEDVIELSITNVPNGNLVTTVKELRSLFGFGLVEAKDHAEQGTVFFRTKNVDQALKYKKHLDQYAVVKITGSRTIEVLYGQKNQGE